jgi:hypothetical protein
MHEQRRPGQVPVELEEIEVDAGDAQQADADEALGDVFDLGQTNDLFVETEAIASRVAAEHDHERLAGLLGLGLGGL